MFETHLNIFLFSSKQLLKEEISVMKDKIEHHPDVTRFAMENLELRGNVTSWLFSSRQTVVSYACAVYKADPILGRRQELVPSMLREA